MKSTRKRAYRQQPGNAQSRQGAPNINRGLVRSVLILALALLAPVLMSAKAEVGLLPVLFLWAVILVVAIIYFFALAHSRDKEMQKRNSKYFQS